MHVTLRHCKNAKSQHRGFNIQLYSPVSAKALVKVGHGDNDAYVGDIYVLGN